MKTIMIMMACLILIGCDSAKKEIEKLLPEISDEATYELVFSTNWTAANFPTNYPDNRHFSGLIGMTHASNSNLFQLGKLASEGIITMAETGSKTKLKEEIELLLNPGLAGALIDEAGIPTGTDKITFRFTVSQKHSHVTIVSMVAPSPDWFVGIDSLPLFSNGNWLDKKEIPLLVMDAGSDSAEVFKAENLKTTPAAVITLLSTPRVDTDFEKGKHFVRDRTIGTFTFTKIE